MKLHRLARPASGKAKGDVEIARLDGHQFDGYRLGTAGPEQIPEIDVVAGDSGVGCRGEHLPSWFEALQAQRHALDRPGIRILDSEQQAYRAAGDHVRLRPGALDIYVIGKDLFTEGSSAPADG